MTTMPEFMKTYECAYCTEVCEFVETGVCKWGMVCVYACSVHGKFQVMESPINKRGQQIR